VLIISFTISGSSTQLVLVSDFTNSPNVLPSIVTNIADLIRVPASTVRVHNLTDVATGAVTTISARRLGGVLERLALLLQLLRELHFVKALLQVQLSCGPF
jgi:hypothetical protein